MGERQNVAESPRHDGRANASDHRAFQQGFAEFGGPAQAE